MRTLNINMRNKPTNWMWLPINEKKCTCCGETKHLTQFYKSKHTVHGFLSRCKCCSKKDGKKFYKSYRNIAIEKAKKWHAENPDKVKQIKEKYKENCRIDPVYKERNRTRRREFLQKNPVSRLSLNIRNKFSQSLKGDCKSETTLKYIGLPTWDAVKEYLESKFLPGMSWDNWSVHGWHIDHIKPCASFDLSKESELYECWHYTNLRPLWSKDNLSKGSKWEGEKHYYDK